MPNFAILSYYIDREKGQGKKEVSPVIEPRISICRHRKVRLHM